MDEEIRTDEELDIMAKIGVQVRKRRKLAGLSQEKLAELTNVSSTTISRLETGRQMVSVAKIVQISKALDVGTGALFGDFDREPEQSKREVDVQILSLLKKYSNPQKNHLLKYMNLFLEYDRED